MDEAFVAEAVRAYAGLVGEAGPPLRDLLRRAIVVADTEEARREALATLRAATRPRILLSHGGDDPALARLWGTFPALPLLFVRSGSERSGADLRSLPDVLRVGTSCVRETRSESTFVCRRARAAPVLVVTGEDAAARTRTLRALLAAPRIP